MKPPCAALLDLAAGDEDPVDFPEDRSKFVGETETIHVLQRHRSDGPRLEADLTVDDRDLNLRVLASGRRGDRPSASDFAPRPTSRLAESRHRRSQPAFVPQARTRVKD